MSIVYPSSGISIVCDCPYAGKTREITESAESARRRRNRFRIEIRRTNEDLVVARDVLMDTRSKMATLQRILGMELGCVVNPYIMTQTTWKDRVREESYLKAELLHLVDYLRECDSRYRTDPAVHPTKLSASAEDLLFVSQEKTLGRLYHDYTVYHSDNEKRVGKCLWEFLKLRENYENKLHQNKVMEHEIAATKKKIFNLQTQFLEDKCLIDYITDHHFKMKGCFLEVFPEDDTPEENDERDAVLDSEALKFKKLWEQSRMEKKRMLISVQAMAKNLKFTNQRIIRAENVCSGNIISFRLFARKVRDGNRLFKLQPNLAIKKHLKLDHLMKIIPG